MARVSVWRLGLVCAIVSVCLTGEALAQPRPYLFSMGRFTAAWANRPWSYDQQIWDHMVTIGATMSGTGLAWCDAEPVEGQYNWDSIGYADFCVDEMRARGIEPAFFVGLTPQWAKLYPNLEPHRTPPREDCVQQFMDFHRFVADRYKGRVKYYFFWNEPNGCSWINDGCGNANSYPLYTQWLIRCSQAIKEADPDAKIIGGNLDYNAGVTHGYEYVQGMYSNGAGPYIDGIAIHPYDGNGTIYWQALTDTRNVMVANGDAAKGIWINEFGWNTTDYQSTADKLTQVLTELKKPQWSFVVMANYLVLNDGKGVENYGLMDADLNPRAGYYAFRDFDKTWPPAVDLSADVTMGTAPLTVHFTDKSYVADAGAWLWDFGDGQTDTAQNPTHVYAQEGSFTVRLTVTSWAGPESAEKAFLIRVGTFPRVAFLGGSLPPSAADFDIIGHLQAQGLRVDAYDDERTNRPTASVISAGHDLVIASSTVLSANVAGDFRHESVPFIFWESSLASSDREALADGPTAPGGQTAIKVVNNTQPVMEGIPVGTVAPTAGAEMYSYCTGQAASGVQVLATSTSNPGDKAVIVAEPGAALLDGGVAAGKRVFLYLYDTTWLKTNTTGKKILDNAVAYCLGKPVAAFSASRTLDVAPATISFTDESTGAVTSWSWDFGDGATSLIRRPSHTYTQGGTYTVSLTAGGPGGPSTLVRTGYVTILGTVAADFDRDRDVDLADFGRMQACFTGPGIAPPAQGCENADLDGDRDVDQDDLAKLMLCLSGPDVPADPLCEQ
jgi:PKD repeat protein